MSLLDRVSAGQALLLSSVCVAALFLAPNPAAAAAPNDAPLEIDTAVGLDEPCLHGPVDMAWSDDGRCYVLNEGSHDVVVFDEGWQEIDRFGGKGGGPGELNFAVAMDLVGDRVIVHQLASRDSFTLDGGFLARVNRGAPSQEFRAGGSTFVMSMLGPRRTLIWKDPRTGECRCELPDRKEAMWELLPAPAGQSGIVAAVFDRHDGYAWLLNSDGELGSRIDLGLGRGVSWFEGGKIVVSGVCADPGRGYWLIHYPEAGGEGYLYEYSKDLEMKGRRPLGSIEAGQVYVSPAGVLHLVGGDSSVIYVVRKPESG